MTSMISFWDRNQSAGAKRRINALVKQLGADEKAVRVLVNTYYNFDTSKTMVPGKPVEAPPQDLQYALEAGVMMPAEHATHDDTDRRLIKLRDRTDRHHVAAAFASSFSTNRLDHRSVLNSYAYHLNRKAHKLKKFTQNPSGSRESYICEICRHMWYENEPEVDLDFNRYRLWSLLLGGSEKHKVPGYALADLTWFSKEGPVEPTDEQWGVLGSILNAIRELPRDAELGDLQKALVGKHKGNKSDRQDTLECLGFCGILQPRDKPNVLKEWFHVRDNELHPVYYKNEWKYPVLWWTGTDGVNEEAVAFWFPELAR